MNFLRDGGRNIATKGQQSSAVYFVHLWSLATFESSKY